jgi:vacuolar-type H+-ATPase subunit H
MPNLNMKKIMKKNPTGMKKKTFAEKFAEERAKQGPGGTFTWQGKKYSTNRADDKKKKVTKNKTKTTSTWVSSQKDPVAKFKKPTLIKTGDDKRGKQLANMAQQTMTAEDTISKQNEKAKKIKEAREEAKRKAAEAKAKAAAEAKRKAEAERKKITEAERKAAATKASEILNRRPKNRKKISNKRKSKTLKENLPPYDTTTYFSKGGKIKYNKGGGDLFVAKAYGGKII